MVFRTYADDVIIDDIGKTVSYEAAEAILAGQLVKLDATLDDAVEPSDTDGERAIGFAIEDAAAGEQVTVAQDGCKVRATSASGTIGSGDLVASAGGATGEEGEVKTATLTTMSDGTAAGTKGDFVVGTATEDDVAVNGDVIVEVNLMGIA